GPRRAAREKERLQRAGAGNGPTRRAVLRGAALLGDRASPEPGGRVPPASSSVTAPDGNASLTLAEAERRHIEAVLRAERGAVPRAAEVLGLSRSALYERIKKHGLVVRKLVGD